MTRRLTKGRGVQGLIRRTITRVRLRACDTVGNGIVLDAAPVVRNLGRMTIADGLSLSSRPARSHLVTGPHGALRVGHRVTVAHGAAIAAHTLVDIGDDVVLGPFVMIMDTDFHDVQDRSRPSEASPIVIEAGARIGAAVTILRGSTIGAGARVCAGSVVSGHIAPGTVVAGIPARPVEERSPAAELPVDIGRVAEVVRRTLGLLTAPSPTSGPHDLAAWDSLGALNIMLSLEANFGVTLEPSDMLSVHSVTDLVPVVLQARLTRG